MNISSMRCSIVNSSLSYSVLLFKVERYFSFTVCMNLAKGNNPLLQKSQKEARDRTSERGSGFKK